MNIAQIEEDLRELVCKPFDPASFVFDLLSIYDAPKSTVTKLRQSHTVDLTGHISVMLKRKLWLRSCPVGQVDSNLQAQLTDKCLKKDAPRIVMCTDGQLVRAKDVKTDQVLDIGFAQLNDAFDFLLPLAGIERYEAVAENPADIKATGRLAKLYDAILDANAGWNHKDHTHVLNLFMTRMLFCFFAEDTSIFEKGQFTQTVLTVANADGSDMHTVLGALFESMNTPQNQREQMPEWARRFPYVNGGLFKERTALPQFNARCRRLFKDCGELAWSSINPDIFGSMIQAIVEPGKRADMGMHYTSVPNIMKVLHPLFLLSLEEEFEAGRDSQAKLTKLLQRIQSIRIFDPACGSGNFLIIAYRELRKLENRVFVRLREIGQRQLPMTGVQLTQFYGIELADFAAETAKLSLWIAEYQLNEQFKTEFGSAPAALPLRDSGTIIRGNALRTNWFAVCPPKEGAETYLVGNPPYLGSSNQDSEQKADMDAIFGPISDNYRNLDYVAAWYLKAADYGHQVPSQAAFVATNSICQGEQVDMLWSLLYARGVEIGFAHQSFKWRNNAAQVAGVTCVIVGIRQRSGAKKVLYSGDLARTVKNIGPYLLDMDDIIVSKESNPINGLPKMDWGNKPTDDGQLILTPEEKDELIEANPLAAKLIRRYYGSQEFIKGVERWCLWISDDERSFAESMPLIKKRIDAVASFRIKSPAESTREYAKYPHRFRQIQDFGSDAILVPIHFSEDRPYFTIGFCEGETSVVSNACYAIYNAEPYILALLSSTLHAVWVSTVCGQLETRIRYSNTMGYHTFPVPNLSDEQKQELEQHAWNIVSAREAHPGKTIAWLYDPETMPANVLQAHRDLDASLERIYIGRSFKNNTERLEYLFKQYVLLKRNLDSAQNGKQLAFKGRKA